MPSPESSVLNKIDFNKSPHEYPDNDKGNLRLYYELELLKSTYEGTECVRHLNRYILIMDTLGNRGQYIDYSTDLKIDKAVRKSDWEILLKPFADYKDFDDCVSRNQDKDDPKAYCAEIMHRVEGDKGKDKSACRNVSSP